MADRPRSSVPERAWFDVTVQFVGQKTASAGPLIGEARRYLVNSVPVGTLCSDLIYDSGAMQPTVTHNYFEPAPGWV